jgi:hypothetical protein
VEQGVFCGSDVTSGIPGGSEEVKGTGNDENISEDKDMSAGQKV